jgi:hypothetical protein
MHTIKGLLAGQAFLYLVGATVDIDDDIEVSL